MENPVRSETLNGVLLITLDNPPVNAASHALRAGLMDALARLDADAGLRAAVLIGAGSTFVAGADVREFGQPAASPTLPEVCAALDASAKPIVAALHGSALGGGLELALACDARVALAGTQLGLPEVTLGLIPGAGGTQRLPRRVGLPRALQMVGGGERIGTAEALRLRLLDAVVEGDRDALRTAALACAAGLRGKQRLSDEAVPAADPAELQATAQAVLKAGKQRPAVQAAVDAVQDAARLPFEQALARERERFLQLRASPEAAALRHQFFAEREAARLPPALKAAPRPFQRLAVIGAGTMGSGIAIAALNAGLHVSLLEQDAEALARGVARIADHDTQRVAAGKLSADAAQQRQARLQPGTDWAALGDADVVIEAVFEDLAVKHEVFRRIDQHARVGAVLASNTSYLDIDAIAAATGRPQDVLGLHFFSPAHVIRLLEVVRGAATSPDVLATGMALGRALGKLPVLCGNGFGFIGNRVYNAYRQQCEFMLEDGAWPEEVDAALRDFGFAMGPFAVADLTGLDIAWRMRRAQAATRDARQRYVAILDHLCEAGRLGRKSGAGYYDYDSAGRPGAQSPPAVRDVIRAASAARGRARQPLSADLIQRRALLGMVGAAAQLLAEGVAQRASDIDVVMVQGYGFPRWRGGPVFWARQQPDRAALQAEVQQLAAEANPGHAPIELTPLWSDGD